VQTIIVTGLRHKGKLCAILGLCQFEQPRQFRDAVSFATFQPGSISCRCCGFASQLV